MQKTAQLKKILLVGLPCLLLMVLWLFIQTRIGIHADNAYLIHAAQSLLSGGTYLHGFFETNPPLIILLNTPVILLTKYTSLNPADALKSYVAMLGLLSVGLSYQLLSKIIVDTKSLVVMLSAITLVIYILPLNTFGEREHLLIILSLPYVWMVLLRMQGQTVPAAQALVAGVMAGIGFCLKPYFFVLAIALEAGLIIHKKNVLAAFRIESICIGLGTLGYLAIIFLFFPDYVHVVAPIVKKYYLVVDWQSMLFNPQSVCVITILISTAILYKRMQHQLSIKMLALTVIALSVSYFLSIKSWYYHQLPMVSMATILGCWCGWQFACDLFDKLRPSAELTTSTLEWLLAAIILFFIVPTNDLSASTINLMTLRFIIAMLSLLSITLVYQSIRKIFQAELLRFLMVISFIGSLFFTASPYGQREQMIVVFALPYIFDRILTLQGKDQSSVFGAITGVMYGIAMIIDYHLALFAILEICVLYQNKKIISKSHETIFFACLVYALFLLGTFNFLLQKFGVNLGIIKQFYLYSLSARHPANEAQFEGMNHYYCYFVAAMSAIHFKKTNYRTANEILLWSLLAFIGLSFWWEETSHFATIPALCVANMLVALILGELLLTKPRLMQLATPAIFAEKILLCTCVFAVLFLGEFSFLFSLMNSSAQEKQDKKNSAITSFFAQHPNSTFDYFAENNTGVLLSYYTNAHFVGQFPLFWWLETMNKQIADQGHHAQQSLALKDESLMVERIAQSLIANQPQYIIVYIKQNSTCVISPASPLGPYHCKTTADTNGGYVKLFSKYQAFRTAWQPYKFVDNYDDFDVYQRS